MSLLLLLLLCTANYADVVCLPCLLQELHALLMRQGICSCDKRMLQVILPLMVSYFAAPAAAAAAAADIALVPSTSLLKTAPV